MLKQNLRAQSGAHWVSCKPLVFSLSISLARSCCVHPLSFSDLLHVYALSVFMGLLEATSPFTFHILFTWPTLFTFSSHDRGSGKSLVLFLFIFKPLFSCPILSHLPQLLSGCCSHTYVACVIERGQGMRDLQAARRWVS